MKGTVWRVALAIFALALMGFGPLHAQAQPKQVSGRASVVNAALLKIGDDYVFLFGVESVVRTQKCLLNKMPWPCYDLAVQALTDLVSTGNVTCTQVAPPDYIGRWLGNCTLGGKSLNEAYVQTGFGVAKRNETMDYVAAEAAAKAAKIGLWQSEFQMPADFRKSENIGIDRP